MSKDLGQVGLWSAAQGLEAADLNEERMTAFLAVRRAAGRRRALGLRGMVPLLSYPREAGVVPAEQASMTPLGELLGQYRSWMVNERNLALTTVVRYENTASRFLQEQALTGDAFAPAALIGADINAFLLRECDRVSAGSANGRVAELRSILRFLYLRGVTPLHLGKAVPPVGGWRFATLPPTMTAADVQALLDSCDRSNTVGVRTSRSGATLRVCAGAVRHPSVQMTSRLGQSPRQPHLSRLPAGLRLGRPRHRALNAAAHDGRRHTGSANAEGELSAARWSGQKDERAIIVRRGPVS